MATEKQSIEYWENIIGEKLLQPQIKLERCTVQFLQDETPGSKNPSISEMVASLREDSYQTGSVFEHLPPSKVIQYQCKNRDTSRYFGPLLEESRNWKASRATYGRNNCVSAAETLNRNMEMNPEAVREQRDATETLRIEDIRGATLNQRPYNTRNKFIVHNGALVEISRDGNEPYLTYGQKMPLKAEIQGRKRPFKKRNKIIIPNGPFVQTSRDWNEPHVTYSRNRATLPVKEQPSKCNVIVEEIPVDFQIKEENLLPEEMAEKDCGTMPNSAWIDSRVDSLNVGGDVRQEILYSFFEDFQSYDSFQLDATTTEAAANRTEDDDINLPPDLPEHMLLNFEKDVLIPDFNARKIQRLKSGAARRHF